MFMAIVKVLLIITLLLVIFGIWSGLSNMMNTKVNMVERIFNLKVTWTCVAIMLIIGGILYWMGVIV